MPQWLCQPPDQRPGGGIQDEPCDSEIQEEREHLQGRRCSPDDVLPTQRKSQDIQGWSRWKNSDNAGNKAK